MLVEGYVNGNKVEYDNTEFELIKEETSSYDRDFLHYIGEGERVLNPKGNVSCFNMFNGYNGTELDLSCFDTSSVVDMKCMFSWSRNLRTLDLSNFDTSKVKDMSYMFNMCTVLEELDLSSFDTSSVTRMDVMFVNCINLKRLDLSSFNTSNVELMDGMFAHCRSLSELDLSSFDTSKVVRMDSMFLCCHNLKVLKHHFNYFSIIVDWKESPMLFESTLNNMYDECGLVDIYLTNMGKDIIENLINDGIFGCDVSHNIGNSSKEISIDENVYKHCMYLKHIYVDSEYLELFKEKLHYYADKLVAVK